MNALNLTSISVDCTNITPLYTFILYTLIQIRVKFNKCNIFFFELHYCKILYLRLTFDNM